MSGRKSPLERTYTLELMSEFCSRIVDGESMRSICEDEKMPNRATIFQWLAKHEDFRQLYEIAKENQADTLADEILFIADNPQEGVKKKETDKGVEIWTGDMIDHRRLQVDARKWIAAHLRPKKYGDRLNTVLTGKDGGPVQIENPNAPTLADFYQTVKRIAVEPKADDAKPDDEPGDKTDV